MIGMVPGPPPYWQKPPTKGIHWREQGESFPSKERRLLWGEVCERRAGQSIASGLWHAQAVFLLAGHNIAPGGRDAGQIIARKCMEVLADVWFVRTDVWFAWVNVLLHARFMAVFYWTEQNRLHQSLVCLLWGPHNAGVLSNSLTATFLIDKPLSSFQRNKRGSASDAVSRFPWLDPWWKAQMLLLKGWWYLNSLSSGFCVQWEYVNSVFTAGWIDSAVGIDNALSTSAGGVYITKEFGMQSIQGLFISGHSVGGEALFIPLKAARWCFEAKKALLPD